MYKLNLLNCAIYAGVPKTQSRLVSAAASYYL